MAVLSWVFIEWFHRGKPTVLGAATGAVAGLVAITPACASVTPMGSLAVGFGAAVFCYLAVTLLKPALGYDDSLDVFGVHGVGGAWGALATALFIASSNLPEGVTRMAQVGTQAASIAYVAILAPILTIVILSLLKLAFGDLSVSAEGEHAGLDLSEHSERAYVD
jgi:Amt family ammonium transporter